MYRFYGLLLSGLICVTAAASDETKPAAPVIASIETTLSTASGQIRQLAFDGSDETFFASQQNAGGADHFTLVLEQPVAVSSLSVTTGRMDGSDRLDAGMLEISADAETFEPLGKFEAGTARTDTISRMIRAIRIKPTEELGHALVIRELSIESDPAVASFKYPVEITVNVDDVPDMKAWADRTARICERAYPMLNEELKSDGFQPPRQITLTLKSDYNGVAATSGTRITGSARYFKSHPDDVGAMVHETAHVVQRYRSRGNPGWLVEGVADYVRFFKFEPGKLGRINAERAHYNGSYRVTAAFLAYLAETHDRDIVRKLNQRMREGRYEEEVFQQLTGMTLPQLDEQWRATLGR